MRVWLKDFGPGWIIDIDKTDTELPYLVEWDTGMLGWHGTELWFLCQWVKKKSG